MCSVPRSVHVFTSTRRSQSASRTSCCVVPWTRAAGCSSAEPITCAWMPQTPRTTSTRRSAGARSARWFRARRPARISSQSTLGSRRGLVRQQDLLERVAAQAEAQRLERDHFLRPDVAQIDLGTEVLDEPRLRALRGRLPDQVVEVDLVRDLVDQAGPHVAVLAEDAGGASLASLGDHLPRTGVALLLDPLHPLVRREHDLRVLRADLAQDDEVAGELVDQLQLAFARDLERPIRDLHVREAVVLEPALEPVELAAPVDRLEEG